MEKLIMKKESMMESMIMSSPLSASISFSWQYLHDRFMLFIFGMPSFGIRLESHAKSMKNESEEEFMIDVSFSFRWSFPKVKKIKKLKLPKGRDISMSQKALQEVNIGDLVVDLDVSFQPLNQESLMSG